MDNIYAFQQRINLKLEEISLQFGEPVELYQPISYVISYGGKRMRPILLLMACDMFGGNVEEALYPALAVELFHNFTLVHDDIMDNAPMRRNRPTVHQKWNSNIAILSGDVMLVQAYQLISKCDQSVLHQVLDVFSNAAVKVCEGQQLDVNYEKKTDVSIEKYIQMISLKTAELLAASLQIGALVAKASEQDSLNIYGFGKNLGIAFQLQDDILDVYGNEEKFGKKTGGDIVANKKTYLFLKALELANHEVKQQINHWVSMDKFDNKEKINAVTSIFNSLDVLRYAKEEVNNYYQKAFDFLDKINVQEFKKTKLKSFVNSLMLREI